jgi:lysophospholipid acyltransferase (LPLAT)-like uncharacterized protein
VRAWWRRIRPHVLSVPIYYLVSGLTRTLRIESPGYDAIKNDPRSIIYSGWHGRTLIATHFFRGLGVWTIISLSKDGDMQNKIFHRFGFQSIRGSTGRGGVKVLVECIRILRKKGERIAFTPDGPRGPSGIVQEGILMLAQKSGSVVVPVGVSSARRWIVKSWDRFMVPKPFSKSIMIFGDPIEIPVGASKEEMEVIRKQIETEMHRLEAEAEARMGHGPTT